MKWLVSKIGQFWQEIAMRLWEDSMALVFRMFPVLNLVLASPDWAQGREMRMISNNRE